MGRTSRSCTSSWPTTRARCAPTGHRLHELGPGRTMACGARLRHAAPAGDHRGRNHRQLPGLLGQVAPYRALVDA
eukprot:4587663-Heterocapsa_arctica.AAC.1